MRAIHLGTGAALAAWLICTTATAGLPEYRLVDLGTAGETRSIPAGINNGGLVAGGQIDPGPFNPGCGFIWESGVKTAVRGPSNTAYCSLTAINASGQVAGTWSSVNGTRSFTVLNGTSTDLGSLGVVSSQNPTTATAINDGGLIVGYSGRMADTYAAEGAFIWQNGSMSYIGTLGNSASHNDPSYAMDINNVGQVVGYGFRNGLPRPFIYQNGQMSELAGDATRSYFPQAINEQGQIVGWESTSTQRQAVLWSGGALSRLPFVSGLSEAYADGINSGGLIVGWGYSSNGTERAAAWVDGQAVNLNTLLPANSGWTLTRAIAVNDRGQIVGYGQYGTQQNPRAFMLHPVPEPSAVGLLMLAGLARLRRYRRS